MKKFLIFCQEILAYIEVYLYSKNRDYQSTRNSLVENGWSTFNKNYSSLFPLDYEKTRKHSKYSSIYILSKQEINRLVISLFYKGKILKFIEDSMNMKYSIDFIAYYNTESVPENNKSKQYFANLWHNDSLFTKNTIKVFILAHDTDLNHGPLNFINKNQSKTLIDKEDISDQKIGNRDVNYFVGNMGDVCIINPKLCLHKAGLPTHKYNRNMIMVQLNPSRISSFKNDLYEKQFFLEPNLPFIRNLFRKKTTYSMPDTN